MKINLVYNILVLLLIGIGLTYPVNLLVGLSESRFLKYLLFYVILFACSFILLLTRHARRRDLIDAGKFSLVLSLFLLVDIGLFRVFFEPFDAVRGSALVMSWFLVFFLIFSVARFLHEDRSKALKKLLTPYFAFCWAMLVSMMAGLVVVLASGLNIEQMEITNRFGYEFYGRMERDSQNQYYGMDEFISPFGLTLFAISPRVFSLSDIPIVLTGWAYEPHLFAFIVAPSFFYISHFLESTKAQLAYIISFFIGMIGASSATFFLTFGFCVSCFLFDNLILRRGLSVVVGFRIALLLMSLMFVLGAVFSELTFSFFENLLQFFENKLIRPTGVSMDTTVGYWEALIQPSSLFGVGPWYVPGEGEIEGVDFGYVALFAVTTIFGAMVLLCAMLIKSGDTLVRSHGYAVLYISIHSLKFPLLFFTYPIWIYFMAVACWALRCRKI